MTAPQLIWSTLIVWFAAVLALGSAGAFVTAQGLPPLPILLGVVLPLLAFAGAYRMSREFRAALLGADLRLVTSVQAWRAGGLGFLALWAYGVLPAIFAWPAGLGDIAIGLTAPWIAGALARSPGFVESRRFALWNWLGVADLVLAVSLGASSQLLPGLANGVTTAPMAQLPLVLIPAYFVPLFLMLHITAFLQARQAARERPRIGASYAAA